MVYIPAIPRLRGGGSKTSRFQYKRDRKGGHPPLRRGESAKGHGFPPDALAVAGRGPLRNALFLLSDPSRCTGVMHPKRCKEAVHEKSAKI